MEVKPRTVHRIISLGVVIDTTGDQWEYRECPDCGHRDKIRWEPFRCVTLERGTMPWASHAQFRMPSEDDLRELARRQGRGPEFEAAVDKAILNNEPLLRLGIGGATAETRVRGTGIMAAADATDTPA